MVAEKSIMRRLEDFPFPPLTCSGGEVTTLAFLHCSLPPLLFLPLPDILSVPLSASPWLSVCLPLSLTLYGYQDVYIKLLTNTLSVHLCFCLFLSHSLPFIPFLSFLCCPCEKKSIQRDVRNYPNKLHVQIDYSTTFCIVITFLSTILLLCFLTPDCKLCLAICVSCIFGILRPAEKYSCKDLS